MASVKLFGKKWPARKKFNLMLSGLIRELIFFLNTPSYAFEGFIANP